MKGYKRSGSDVPHLIKLENGWGWVVNFTL